MQETADLVTFTEEILNGKLHLLCSATYLAKSLHIISFLFSHYCLFQNSILHKILKLGV